MVRARMLNILNLVDDARCFETVRAMRWPQGVTCPHCHSPQITKQGRDESQPERQKYECNACRKRFDDLTGTIFAGHHQPLRVWMLCLYFMGLNLSNEQIAHELDLNSDDAQKMTTQLREGIVERKPEVTLSGEVECDEAYVVAGHKGHPEEVKKTRMANLAGGQWISEYSRLFAIIERLETAWFSGETDRFMDAPRSLQLSLPS